MGQGQNDHGQKWPSLGALLEILDETFYYQTYLKLWFSFGLAVARLQIQRLLFLYYNFRDARTKLNPPNRLLILAVADFCSILSSILRLDICSYHPLPNLLDR